MVCIRIAGRASFHCSVDFKSVVNGLWQKGQPSNLRPAGKPRHRPSLPRLPRRGPCRRATESRHATCRPSGSSGSFPNLPRSAQAPHGNQSRQCLQIQGRDEVPRGRFEEDGEVMRFRIADCRLRIADCGMRMAFYVRVVTPRAASFRNPQSAVRNPQSAIRNPQSAIRNRQRHVVPGYWRSKVDFSFG